MIPESTYKVGDWVIHSSVSAIPVQIEVAYYSEPLDCWFYSTILDRQVVNPQTGLFETKAPTELTKAKYVLYNNGAWEENNYSYVDINLFYSLQMDNEII